MFTAGKRTALSRPQILYIVAGSLLWAYTISLAFQRPYQLVPGALAGLLGAFLIESGWAERPRR